MKTKQKKPCHVDAYDRVFTELKYDPLGPINILGGEMCNGNHFTCSGFPVIISASYFSHCQNVPDKQGTFQATGLTPFR